MKVVDRPASDRPLFAFDNSFARELSGLYEAWKAASAPAPRLLTLNRALAAELGADADALASPDGVAALVGNALVEGSTPVAQAYAGHQFGGYSPRLGDGRALLLGEVVDIHGRRRDLHLKGSGRTPFARGGDGKAAVGPMLREHIVGEAMHGLGIPTTRALAVIATGERVAREGMLPGAVLVRVASSHLRVGTFQYAAAHPDRTLVPRVLDYAVARHYPDLAGAENTATAFLDAVVEAQASLVAQWMLVGFIHGVMNTDNMTISGETIDYGPCAFMEVFDPATVFSSIDHGGRYAYGNQPQIAQWNLARLAETLLPLVDTDQDRAVEAVTEILRSFGPRFEAHWVGGMRAKLGITEKGPDDLELVNAFLRLLHAQSVDYTSAFRALSSVLRGEGETARTLFADPAPFDEWAQRWTARAQSDDAATQMDRVNPLYIPRNHLVEEALAQATAGDISGAERLIAVVSAPFDQRPGLERYAAPAPANFGPYVTYCGT